MTNRITLVGKVLDAPKIRSFEVRGGAIEIVSLWIEVRGEERTDRFTVEINCPKAQVAAKAMRADVLAKSPAHCATTAGRTRPPANGPAKSMSQLILAPGRFDQRASRPRPRNRKRLDAKAAPFTARRASLPITQRATS